MATQRSRRSPGDLTGRQSEALARKAAEQQQRPEGAISTTSGSLGAETMVIDEDALIDVTNPQQPKVVRLTDSDIDADDRAEIERTRSTGADVVEVGGVEVSERTRIMRVAEECTPTIGFGPDGPRDYHFVPGQTYKVPEVVYNHLDGIGYVWH